MQMLLLGVKMDRGAPGEERREDGSRETEETKHGRRRTNETKDQHFSFEEKG